MMRLIALSLALAMTLTAGRAQETAAVQTAPAPSAPAPHAPTIILKLDDLGAGARDQWQRLIDFLQQRQIKASIGIVCNSLDKENPLYVGRPALLPGYVEWIQKVRQTGLVEFWVHGYDHMDWLAPDGKECTEFQVRSYEEQKARLAKCEALSMEQLGIPMPVFGPPGGGPLPKGTLAPDAPKPPALGGLGFNADTLQATHDVPEFAIWLYPTLLDDAGRAIVAKGKITILDRVPGMNIENPTFIPNYAEIVKNYPKTAPNRDYIVLQGHPWHWKEPDWENFTKIVDFLAAQGCTFSTPSEYVKQRAASGAAKE